MGTPFTKVYNVFYSNVRSYKLALLDNVNLEVELSQWLQNGLSYFTMARTNIYNYNVAMQEFNCILHPMEITILGKCMALEYLNTHLMDEKNLSSALNSRDYRTYSPAKQLDSLIKTKEHILDDIDLLMSRYSYSGRDLKELFGRKS